MLDGKQLEELVERRARGESLRSIAEKMDISKTTVLAHVRKLSIEIKNARSFEIDAMIERSHGRGIARFEAKLRMISRLEEEILRRDLSNVPLDRLVTIWKDIENLVGDDLRVRFWELRDYDPIAEIENYSKSCSQESSWNAS